LFPLLLSLLFPLLLSLLFPLLLSLLFPLLLSLLFPLLLSLLSATTVSVIVKCTGNPWVFSAIPVPVPAKTHTHGTVRVSSWVSFFVPIPNPYPYPWRVTHGYAIKLLCHSEINKKSHLWHPTLLRAPPHQCIFLHNHWTEFYKPGVVPKARGDAKNMAVGSGGSAQNWVNAFGIALW
jgi:hypothetical protein